MDRFTSQDELVFLPLGGSGEIGMNFNAYGFGPENDRQWIIVDCGVLFGREGHTPGVDLIMPDIRYLAERRQNVLGIIATHAHEDHIGAIAHLWPSLRCPVYATPFTARLITGKLDEAGLSSKVHVKEVAVGGKLKLGPFDLDFISITHSILEPNLLAIRTPLGVVAHTGDWKIDPNPLLGEATDEAALEQLGNEGVLALVCDSTNALVPGSSGSEAEIRENLAALIAGLKGRVAVTGFASNVARLDSVARAASLFCISKMASSLPGMTRLEKITVSPSPRLTLGWLLSAMRASAARGSPWLPVHRYSTLCAGRSATSVSSSTVGKSLR